jgi:hypothetical protein
MGLEADIPHDSVSFFNIPEVYIVVIHFEHFVCDIKITRHISAQNVLKRILPINFIFNYIINYYTQNPLCVVCLNQKELSVGNYDVHSNGFSFYIEFCR